MTATATAVTLLAACGGGDGSSSGGGNQPPVITEKKLSGVAATGAPFAGATVTVQDQTGTTVCTTQTDANGAYSCTLPVGTKAPLVIKAQRDDLTLYSTTASTDGGTANVTPLTTIIVSQLAPNGDPASLAGAIHDNPSAVTADAIKAQVTQLLEALKPLLAALGQSAIDPIAGAFVANGTGPDKVLDSISVTVLPNGSVANIEITAKSVAGTDGGAPVSIVYTTGSTTPSLPPIAPEAIVDTPTPAMVADLFKRISACFALPLTQRVDTATNDSTPATGTAANVRAPECRSMFADISTFYSNGAHVGRDNFNRGAYNSLFRPGPTGTVFDRGNFEFVRGNGAFVFSYRWTDSFGNSDTDTLVARNVDGTLKLEGNGFNYSAAVRPVSEHRDFLNTPAFSSYTTGYDISVDNRVDSGGASIFGRVEVTGPDGVMRKLIPQPGLSYLVFEKDDHTPSGTSILRLRGQFQNASTPGPVVAKEPQMVFVSPEYEDDAIVQLQNQSVWTLEFFAPGGQSLAVQKYRTLSRAQSIGEIRQIAMPDLTPAMRAEMIEATASDPGGVFIFGQPVASDPNVIDFSANGNLDAWTVPQGALAPTSFTAYGRAPSPAQGVQGPRFNDSIGVGSTARKVLMRCSPQSASDTHCDSADPSQYAWGTLLNTFELSARTQRQVVMSKKFATYKLK